MMLQSKLEAVAILIEVRQCTMLQLAIFSGFAPDMFGTCADVVHILRNALPCYTCMTFVGSRIALRQ